MSAPGIRLGIDFGTSNTVAMVGWPDGRVRPLLFDGSPLLPSAVYADPAGRLIVGVDATYSARLDPARFEPNPKRRIDDGSVLLGEREVPVVELIGAVLARVAAECRRVVGDTPVETTVTCRAAWGATRRLVLADAAAAAGLGTVRLVPEPVAAAAYFTRVLGRKMPDGSALLVYDFGAGTFDASVVARRGDDFEVLAVEGRTDLGGVDLDAALVQLVGSLAGARDQQAWQRLTNPTDLAERRARWLLWEDVRLSKQRLSREPTADLVVPLVDVDLHLTRAELERAATPLLNQTVQVAQGVLRWANLAPGQLAGVFLVGGSSRIPLVATLLHRALGQAPVAIDQPELVVAEGSVRAGGAATPVSAPPLPGPHTGQPTDPPPVRPHGLGLHDGMRQQVGPHPAPVVPPPVSPARRFAPGRRRRRWLVPVAIVLAVLLVGALAWWITSRPDGRATGNTAASSQQPSAGSNSAGPTGTDDRPCEFTTRKGSLDQLPYRCPMVWDRPGTTLTRIPVIAAYSAEGNTAADKIDELVKGPEPQYFKCHIKGGTFTFAAQPGLPAAKHNWWAFTQGDDGVWGYVPEVYLLGGDDMVPDGGLTKVCTPEDVALAGQRT